MELVSLTHFVHHFEQKYLAKFYCMIAFMKYWAICVLRLFVNLIVTSLILKLTDDFFFFLIKISFSVIRQLRQSFIWYLCFLSTKQTASGTFQVIDLLLLAQCLNYSMSIVQNIWFHYPTWPLMKHCTPCFTKSLSCNTILTSHTSMHCSPSR